MQRKFVVLTFLFILVLGLIAYLVVSHRIMKQEPLPNQLQEQVTDFLKKDAKNRHLKLHNIKVVLVWQQMIDNDTIVAIFDYDEMTTENYEKAEDSPQVKGMLKYKTENLKKLSTQDLELVDNQIQQWIDIINRYRTNPEHSGMRVKIIETIINGKLDPITALLYGEGINPYDYHPISLKDAPSDEEVEQGAYHGMEDMINRNHSLEY